jgi:hypothetical protein
VIPIFPLLPEELNYFIYKKGFETSLSSRMGEVKDVFVFGCTVALRVSDFWTRKVIRFLKSFRIKNGESLKA